MVTTRYVQLECVRLMEDDLARYTYHVGLGSDVRKKKDPRMRGYFWVKGRGAFNSFVSADL